MGESKVKYVLIYIILTVLTILTVSYATDNLVLGNLPDFTNVSGIPVIKKIETPYAFKSSSYANFDLFPLDGEEFNKYPTRFCGEHNVPYGNDNIDHILEETYHINNVLTKNKSGGNKISDPKGDIDTSADVYCDESGKLVRKDKTYYGYRENTAKESPSGSVKTNWVYIERKVNFDCEGQSSGMAGKDISDGGMAFLLACFKAPGYRNYSDDELQWAVWDWINGNTKGHELDDSAQIFDNYHTASENPNVDCTPGDNVGTVLNGDTYHVGPFQMSNYVRAQDFTGVDRYGNLQAAFNSQGDYKGTIVKAEAVMNNGARVEFPVPEPGEEFYIDLPGSQIAGADELVDIVFTYQRIHASGNGSLWIGHAYIVSYNEESSSLGCGTYHCSKHPEHSHGGCGCDYSHEVSDGEGGTTTCNHCKGDHTDCHGHPRLSYGPYGDKALCTHGHWDCYKFKWKYTGESDECQDGFAGNGALVIEVDTFTIRVSIPVKTVMKIYKYITKVDHVGEDINLWNLGEARREMTMEEKYDDAVPVERGDLVTYKIEIVNESRFPTRVKVKDTLPEECEKIYMPPEIETNQWIEVNANDKREFTVQVRPTKDSGKDTNVIEFITKNDTAEHMQFVYWGDDATHGPRQYGNIVNTDGNDGTTDLKEKDSDTYIIKEYYVGLEKFIYKVEHYDGTTTKGTQDERLFVFSEESNKRSRDDKINSGSTVTEDVKKNNKVFVEVGDFVYYKIRVHNTVESSVSEEFSISGSRKDGPYYEPDKIYVDLLDTLPKDAEFESIEIDDVSGNGGDIRSWTASKGTKGSFEINDLMVPPGEVREIRVKIKVTEYQKGNLDDYENNVKIKGDIKNINRTPSKGSPAEDKFCVIKNTADGSLTTSSDWYRFKEYNIAVEKYIANVEHNEATSSLHIANTAFASLSDERSRSKASNNITEAIKQHNPVYVEYGDKVTYQIKIYNTVPTSVSDYYGVDRDALNDKYINPDRVFVNLEDWLPLKYSKLTVEVDDNSTPGANLYSISKEADESKGEQKKFTVKDLMVPTAGVRTITVTLIVEEYEKATIEQNSVKFIEGIRNINRETGSPREDKYCLVENYNDSNDRLTVTPSAPNKYGNKANDTADKLASSDWYILNNYNSFTDKYVYKYNEAMQIKNNAETLTKDGLVSDHNATGDDANVLIVSRRNDTATEEEGFNKNDISEKVLNPKDKEEYKKKHPVSVEKTENIVYRIAITNESKELTKAGGIPSGKKQKTQFRPSVISDFLEVGLEYKGVTAKLCSDVEGKNVLEVVSVGVSENGTITKTDSTGVERAYKRYDFKIGTGSSPLRPAASGAPTDIQSVPETLGIMIDPGETLILEVSVDVVESNMYLLDLENKAIITEEQNINHVADDPRIVKKYSNVPDSVEYNEDISKQDSDPKQSRTVAFEKKGSSEFVRMKDLVIAGKVWVDFNRDGKMNDEDKVTDYIGKLTGNYVEDITDLGDRYKNKYYNINEDATKKGVKVRLYRVRDGKEGELLRTTYTDNKGLYSFSRKEDESCASYYDEYNYTEVSIDGKVSTVNYSPNDPSSNKWFQRVDKAEDKDENGNYKLNAKYIQYYIEFEYDGIVFKSTEFYAGMDNLNKDSSASDYGSYKTDYQIDSNACEFPDKRDAYNNEYEYISYNKAYDTKLMESESKLYGDQSTLKFDKTGHSSQLIENREREMTARSFINYIENGPPAGKRLGVNSTDENATNYLWLFKFDEPGDKFTPETEYLKYINLGLELREDVDIALTKDVYKVKTTINGEEMEYDFNENDMVNGLGGEQHTNKTESKNQYLRDFMMNKPYGIELYESDYKMRIEQYPSDEVRKYKGIESELNVEVTYRISINNLAIKDDEAIEDSYDTKLDVRVNEILDLYDENFIKYNSDSDVVKVKEKDPATGLYKSTLKEIKVAEAWYYKEISKLTADNEAMLKAQDSSASNANIPAKWRYKIDNTRHSDGKPIYVQADDGDYVRINLKLNNQSTRFEKTMSGSLVTDGGATNYKVVSGGKTTSFSQKENNFTSDGYNTLYISGMGNEVIPEGEDLDIYVKYVVDKGKQEVKNSNERYSETKFSFFKTKPSQNSEGEWEKIVEGSTETTNVFKMDRSLRILDQKDKTYGLGTENIAQVNAYSVWYTDGKPAAIVDMDSNAGNIGLQDDNSIGSADEFKYYEDTSYKAGIEIVADDTENTIEKIKEKYKLEIFKEYAGPEERVKRVLTGTVWDDTRSDTLGENRETQYVGNGILSDADNKIQEAKSNELVTILYKGGVEFKKLNGKNASEREEVARDLKEKDLEKNDLKVRTAKAEFIEVVQTAPNKYYEQVLTNVTWDQVQNIRTDENGDYKLKGFVPGNYIVRYTYGDELDERNASDKAAKDAGYQEDMLIFNGQDYKSTQYTTGAEINGNSVKDGTELSDTELNRDKVIEALEYKSLNDARDDEVRRLEVNGYSEIINNSIAEELKGLGNGYINEEDNPDGMSDAGKYNLTTESSSTSGRNEYIRGLITPNSKANDAETLMSLVRNTYMNAETPEFLVRAEKLQNGEQNDKYLKRRAIKQIFTDWQGNTNYYYQELENLMNEDIEERIFKITDIDFGVEYRPENQIKLSKEIDEIKLVTEDNETLMDLFFYTTGLNTENGEQLVHHIDEGKSIGYELVQFNSNEYDNKLLSSLSTERNQWFAFIQVDEDILQGCTIEIRYKFIAENRGEVDRITTRLNDIRYRDNPATSAIIGSDTEAKAYLDAAKLVASDTETQANHGIDPNEYKASKLASILMKNKMFIKDTDESYYRKDKKKIITSKTDTDGYFGQFVGYGYYAGGPNASDIDTIASMKFDKIIDYVDTDLEFNQEKETNKYNNVWVNYAATDLKSFLSATAGILSDTPTSILQPTYTNPENIAYAYTMVSVDDRLRDDTDENVQNIDLSRFLLPKVVDDSTSRRYDTLTGKDLEGTSLSPTTQADPSYEGIDKRDYYYDSTGIIYLPVFKTFAAEADTDDLEFENYGEVIQFTALTGRRTNFATTVGNADVHSTVENPKEKDVDGSKEYKISSLEPDSSSSERITLTPPTGLTKKDRAVKQVIETAKVSTQYFIIIGAVVVVALFGTRFIIKKIKKRRIK